MFGLPNWIIVVMIIVMLGGVAIHESIHYMQIQADPRVEFNGFGVDGMGFYTSSRVINQSDVADVNAEQMQREVVAYSVHFSFTIASMLAFIIIALERRKNEA